MRGGAKLIHFAGCRGGGDFASATSRRGCNFVRRSFNGVGIQDGVHRKAVQLIIVVVCNVIALFGVCFHLERAVFWGFSIAACVCRAKPSLPANGELFRGDVLRLL